MQLPPPPPRPRLDPYLFDHSLRPQTGSSHIPITESNCHSGWHDLSNPFSSGMPPRLSANVDCGPRPCRPVSYPPSPTPSATSLPRHRPHYRRRIPSPRDRAACARFRLSRKKRSAVRPTAGDTTAAVVPHPRPLLGILRDLTRIVLPNSVCTCRLSSSVGCATRWVCASVRSASHCARPVIGICGGLPPLKTPRAFNAVLNLLLAKHPVHSPRHHKCQRSRPRYLLWALGGYVLLALCCLLVWSLKPHSPPPLAKHVVGKDVPVWVLELDVVDIHALRDANPEYDFFVLPS